MARSRRIQIYSLSVLLNLFILVPLVAAQGIPSMHWGGMELQTSVNNCIGRARKAVFDARLNNTQVARWQVYGHNNNAAVLVSCAAMANKRSYLTVVASSSDSRAAELLRNDVRTRIARMREFD